MARVLVACEFSGTVRDAFLALGHDAYSCDLLPTESNPDRHYIADALEAITFKDWDLMIAHPPCTHLAVAGAGKFKAKRKDGRQQAAVDFVKRLWEAPISRIAIENPIGILTGELRHKPQIIQPYEYGDDAKKATCLYLRNLPHLIPDPANLIQGRMICPECTYVLPTNISDRTCFYCGKRMQLRWANQLPSGKDIFSNYSIRIRAQERSRTFPGIANAMAEQWGAIL